MMIKWVTLIMGVSMIYGVYKLTGELNTMTISILFIFLIMIVIEQLSILVGAFIAAGKGK